MANYEREKMRKTRKTEREREREKERRPSSEWWLLTRGGREIRQRWVLRGNNAEYLKSLVSTQVF